jgi:hypothetical protein
MCLNCGCGEHDTRHKESDITLEDVRQASAGTSMHETLQNMRTYLEKIGASGGSQSMGGSDDQPGTL